MNEKKLKRMEYLGEVIKKYMITEPKLELSDLAEIFVVELPDDLLKEFIKIYKREIKKGF